MIKYIHGDLFSHTPIKKGAISILCHSCNCRGVWGGGIAAVFRRKYPIANRIYEDYCDEYRSQPTKLLGTTQLILPEKDSEPLIACLFTSDMSGSGILPPHEIVHYTDLALQDLVKQLKHLQSQDKNIEVTDNEKLVVNMPKINSGIFNVPWDQTEAVLNKYPDVHFNVYVID
ncbi:ADP-ribose 1''-phosphate phosphatase [Scheffersomyces amazonensis]|uniref:ADP-ribose 1''-phosphate phosphatase n=1 Tax=Scheffersomyces amazonensis TaxID=1078765 RepID=UPI00315DE00E